MTTSIISSNSKFNSTFKGSISEFISYFISNGGEVCRERGNVKVLKFNGVQFSIEYTEQ